MEVYKRLVIYSALIYIAVLLVAIGYNNLVIIPSHALLGNTVTTSTQLLNATIAAQGVHQANSVATSIGNIEIIIGEIVAISIIAILEMKYKIISRLIKKKVVQYLLLVVPFIIGLVLLVSLLGYVYGFLAFIGFIALVLFIYIIFTKLAKGKTLAACFVILIYMIFFQLLSPTASFFTTNQYMQLGIEAGYAIILFMIAMVNIYFLGKGTSLKNVINITAVLGVFVTSLYFGLLLNPYFMLALLILLSIYDYIAVFLTHHMQFMAANATKQLLPALLLIGDEKDINKKLQAMGDAKLQKKLEKETKKKPLNAGALGTGDLFLPAALIASAVFYMPKLAILLVIGAIVGMGLNALLLQTKKFKTGIPALPLLCLGMCIAFAIGLLI